MVIPDVPRPDYSKILDMFMMMATSGKERTASEFTDILTRAGFRVNRIIPTDSDVSMIEALPA